METTLAINADKGVAQRLRSALVHVPKGKHKKIRPALDRVLFEVDKVDHCLYVSAVDSFTCARIRLTDDPVDCAAFRVTVDAPPVEAFAKKLTAKLAVLEIVYEKNDEGDKRLVLTAHRSGGWDPVTVYAEDSVKKSFPDVNELIPSTEAKGKVSLVGISSDHFTKFAPPYVPKGSVVRFAFLPDRFESYCGKRPIVVTLTPAMYPERSWEEALNPFGWYRAALMPSIVPPLSREDAL